MLKIQKYRKRARAVIRARGRSILFSDGLKLNHKAASIDRDFFDGHSVTEADIAAWLLAVPRLDPTGPRAARYIAAYDVAGKIKAAKRAGTFWQIIAATPAPRGF